MVKPKKSVIIELDDKQKKMLRILLKHQKTICDMKEKARREGYYR